jgi:hypothetical protein
MPQRFLLDRRRAASYLGLVLLACARGPEQPSPATFRSVESGEVRKWVDGTVPGDRRILRFKWLFSDGEASLGGRGSVRIAPPDSLRFDVAGPWGMGTAAAVVFGEAAEWVHPPDIIARLLPNYPLMWAMFGVARPPAESARLRGIADSTVVAWQAVDGADTVTYIRVLGPASRLRAEVRRAGQVVGRVDAKLHRDGTPVSARLSVPSVPARLDITIVAIESAPPFPPALWAPPAP